MILDFNSFKLNEDNTYISNDSINSSPLVKLFPLGKEVEYTEERMRMAITYGMVLTFGYKGFKDLSVQHFRERVICPLVLGRSRAGNVLFRGFHMIGWSVSSNAHMRKIWRLFRVDNIKWMLFNGQFYRDAPQGYNNTDPLLQQRLIIKADFYKIKSLQLELSKKDMIDNTKTIELRKIQIELIERDTNDNSVVNGVIMKDKLTPNAIAVIGTQFTTNNVGEVILLSDKSKFIGSYEIIKIDNINSPKYNNLQLYKFIKAI